MFGRLLPRETSFFDFFEQHAATDGRRGRRSSCRWSRPARTSRPSAKRITDIEHETDTITHHCVEALHKTFITPIDRDEIHRLITQDGRHHGLRRGRGRAHRALRADDDDAPTCATSPTCSSLGRCRSSSACAACATCSRTPQAMLQAVHRHQPARERGRRDPARARWRGCSRKRRTPITIIKWKEIYENLENATDRCEDVANIIEGVVLEHA